MARTPLLLLLLARIRLSYLLARCCLLEANYDFHKLLHRQFINHHLNVFLINCMRVNKDQERTFVTSFAVSEIIQVSIDLKCP